MNVGTGIQMRKSNSIEFFRILFILVLCIHHLNISNVIQHGYIVVEFFGILSGFLLAKSANSSELSAYEYTMRRFKRFAPIYIWALAVQITLMSVQEVINGEFKFLDTFLRQYQKFL